MTDLERTVVRTVDPDEASASIATVFPGLRVRADPAVDAPFAYEYDLAREPRFQVHRLRCTGTLRASGSLPDSVAVGRRESGRVRLQRGARAVDTARPYLRPTGPSELEADDAELRLVAIEPATVTAFLGRTEERAPTAGREMSAAATTAWSLVMDHAVAVAVDGAAPAEVDELLDVLCWSLVRAFGDPFAETSARHSGPAALRRAVAHIEEHAQEAVVIADVAAAARVSPRQLHLLFRRELATTPHRFLRDLRLDRARTDLLQGADEVAVVAARHGVGHAGRFAADYRERFGETPATTVRAARA